MNYVYVKLIQF